MKKAITFQCSLVLLAVSYAWADERDVLMKRIKTEMPQKCSEYINFVKYMQGGMVEKIVDGKTKTVRQEERWEWKNSGDLALLKWQRTLPRTGSYVLGKNSHYSFRIEKGSNRPSWVLTTWAPNDAPPSPENAEFTTLPQNTADWLSAAYAMFDKFLPQFLANPALRIKEAIYVNGKEDGLIRIDFEHDVQEDKALHPFGQPLDGWMILDANHYWYVREYNLLLDGQAEKGRMTMRWIANYECEIGPNGIPIPRKLSSRSMPPTAPEGEWWTEKIREYTLTVHNGLPESEFTLPAFGLPEPYGATANKGKPLWWLWSALAAILFGLMALYFYKRKDRVSV